MMFKDNFSKVEKYKMFRTMYEIIHPTISKKNISNYKIILDEKILPVRVYYPMKLSSINSVIIYIPGEGNVSKCFGEYDNILKNMALICNKLIIAIDYFNEEIKYPYLFDKCFETVDFIIEQLNNNGINDIIFMGDSFGGNLVSTITLKRIDSKKHVDYKEILFYPIISGEYFGKSQFDSLNRDGILEKEDISELGSFFKKYISNKRRVNDKYICPIKCKDFNLYPNTLIFSADSDVLRDECKYFSELIKGDYFNVLFAEHGFLDSTDEEMKDEVYDKLNEFIN